MRLILRNALLLIGSGCLMFAQQATPKKAAAHKPPTPSVIEPKGAYDKEALEAYVRHLFVWGRQIKVEIGNAKPSAQLPGFNEIPVIASAGEAKQEELFLVSKDGKKILKASVFDMEKNPFQSELDKLKTEFQPSFGTPGATVVIVIFTDFQCPFCKQEAKMIRDNLLSAFPKQVRVYFKDFPLTAVHPWAKPASMAGRCVFRQKPPAFWDFHDWVYEHQGEITPDNLKSKVLDWAKTKDLDTLLLSSCIETKATEAEVDKNIADGKALNVYSTPTLFINGRRMVGQTEWMNLRQIIENEIEYQKTARNAGEDCGCSVALPSPLSPK